MSILHSCHLKRSFRDGPHISHLDSQIVNTSQVTPEDLSIQLTRVGVGKGPCEGVSKINFYGQRGIIWKKTAPAINRLPCVSKIADSNFSAETILLECRMLAQILRTAFFLQFQAVHKAPSRSRSAALTKRCKGAFRVRFPDSHN